MRVMRNWCSEQPFVSVIIPVYNDPDRLRICLERLARQTYSATSFEVIVVDNGSIAPIDESLGEKFKRAIFCREQKCGSYAARNTGIAHAQGEVFAFTDSDCMPSETWIASGVEALKTTAKTGLVGGRIELCYENPDRPSAAEVYDRVMQNFHQEENIRERKFAVTANLFTFRRVLEDVGLFDETLKSTGDLEWGNRVSAAGYQLIYSHPAQVDHPARRSIGETYRRAIRIAGGRYDLQKKKGYSGLQFCREIARDMMPPIRLYFRVWSDKRLENARQKVQVMFMTIFVKYVYAWEKIRLQFGGRSVRG